MRRLLIAAALVALLFPAPAAAESPRALLRDLAANVTHGWVHQDLSYEAMEARLDAGRRLYVTCGHVAQLAQRRLTRHGVSSRLVGSFSERDVDMRDVPDTRESHAMIEVWLGGEWALFDLDSNVQPVSADGDAITLERFTKQRHRHYRTLASDPLNTLRGSPFPRYEAWIFAEHEAWFDRVLGTATVMVDGEYVYAGANDRLEQTPGYRQIPRAEWEEVLHRAPSDVRTRVRLKR